MACDTPLHIARGLRRGAMWHELKCWPESFRAVRIGIKPFEYRKADRDYRVGDTLLLREWEPLGNRYTGETCTRAISYVLPGGAFGVPETHCVLGLAR